MTAKRLQYTNGLGGGAVDCGQEAAQRGCRVGAERAHDIDELNDTEAALAALVFGNERLVLVETPGDRHLAQSLPLAQLDGCPLGLSIVGARGADAMLLELAKQL